MGKKKGKDKNKLARMSEEERLRYLQHRAELEEEAKRRKQQLISTFMKVKCTNQTCIQHLQYCADSSFSSLAVPQFSFYITNSRSFRFLPLFVQNKLKKEDAFTRLNVAKIKSEWRDILRKIKCRELQQDLKAIKKECDESIHRKNSVIRRLLSDLDESEEIYSAMLHSHMNIIEKLIGEDGLSTITRFKFHASTHFQ